MDNLTLANQYTDLRNFCKERNWKCRSRNRRGKIYVTIDWNHLDFKAANLDQNSWQQALNACYSFFPKGRSTSGGMGSMTFRINP